MFGKIVSLLGVAAALFLAGCSSLNPPFDEKSSYDPQEFCGNWVYKDGKTTVDIAISPFESSPPNAILIQIVATPEKPEKDFGKLPPLVGRIIKIREKYFLAVRVAIEKMFLDAQYNSTALLMLSPRFSLLELTRKDGGFDLQFVMFSTASNVKWQSVWQMKKSPDDWVNIVLTNSTEEIQNMLERGEYTLSDKQFFHVIRK